MKSAQERGKYTWKAGEDWMRPEEKVKVGQIWGVENKKPLTGEIDVVKVSDEKGLVLWHYASHLLKS